MNWSLLLGFTLLLLVVAFVRLRAERARVRVVNWFVVYPALLAALLYAWFGSHWLELGLAVAASALTAGAWWAAVGSYLPPPTSDNIQVWGQETKKPAQATAEAQAEVERLKKEKEELEKELKELRAKRNGKG
jgi:hypothetical protein